MLPPWNKIEWGLPINRRMIEFVTRSGATIKGYHDEWGFCSTHEAKVYEDRQIERWRYVDVHE